MLEAAGLDHTNRDPSGDFLNRSPEARRLLLASGALTQLVDIAKSCDKAMHLTEIMRFLPCLTVSCGPQLVLLGLPRYCLDLLGTAQQRWQQQPQQGKLQGERQQQGERQEEQQQRQPQHTEELHAQEGEKEAGEEEEVDGGEERCANRYAFLASVCLNFLACYGDPLACKSLAR